MQIKCPGLTLDLFQPFLDSLPLGIHIWRLEDPDDSQSLCLIAANALIDKYVSKPTTSMIGQRILSIFPHLSDSPTPEALRQIVITQNPQDLGETKYIDGPSVGIYSVTAFTLPDQCLAITFRDVTPYRQASEALAERVKELTCLLDVLQIGADPDLPLDDILMQIVGLLPSAWQHPEIASACLTLGERQYATASFQPSRWMQSSAVVVRGEPAGLLQVAYLSDGVVNADAPFLTEEQTLLDAVSSRIAWVIERKQTEAAQGEQRVLLEALQETTAVLNSTLHVDEVLDRILDSIGRVVPHDAASIQLIEDNIARTVRSKGYEKWGLEEIITNFRTPVSDAPRLRQMAESRLPTTNPIVEDYGFIRDVIGGTSPRSWAGAPIIDGDQVIGFINVSSSAEGFFNDQSAQRLAAFAHPVSIAIRNARQHNEVAERNRRLIALNEITRISNATPDLEQLLKNLADKVTQITAADHCYVMLWNPTTNQPYTAAASGENHEQFLKLEVPPNEPTLTQLVLETGEPTVRRVSDGLPPYSPEFREAIRPFLKGEWILIAPLRAANIPLGSLLVAIEDEHALPESEIEWIKQAAELTSLAIARAHAYNQMEDKVEERTDKLRVSNMLLRKQIAERRGAELAEREQRVLAEALQATAAILNSTLNLDEVLDQILENVGRVVPHDCANIMLVEQGTASLARSRGYQELGAKDALLGVYFPANSMFDMRQLIEAGEPVLFPDTHANPNWARVPESRWVRSYLGSPIRMDGEVIGFLNLDSATPDFFDPIHVQRLQAFADQAAVAIKNARLYEQARKLAVLEERERLARDLHDAVSQTLWSASLIADVLPTLWEQDPEEGKRNLEQLQELTHVARDEMRSLLLDLRPGALSQVALRDLITQLVKTLGGRTSADFQLNITGSAQLAALVQLNLYRIAQEALNNVVKHARASRVEIDLKMSDAEVLLRIRDNGQGFNPNQILAGHLGHHIMVERAQSIGATFSIDSTLGAGAEIRVHWLQDRNKA